MCIDDVRSGMIIDEKTLKRLLVQAYSDGAIDVLRDATGIDADFIEPPPESWVWTAAARMQADQKRFEAQIDAFLAATRIEVTEVDEDTVRVLTGLPLRRKG